MKEEEEAIERTKSNGKQCDLEKKARKEGKKKTIQIKWTWNRFQILVRVDFSLICTIVRPTKPFSFLLKEKEQFDV